MTYVVCEPCVKCKYGDCVDVCPVDCFYEGDDMLYINPDECIDCDACVRACPAEAIFIDDEVPEKWAVYTQINADFPYADSMPVTAKGDVTRGKNWDAETAKKANSAL